MYNVRRQRISFHNDGSKRENWRDAWAPPQTRYPRVIWRLRGIADALTQWTIPVAVLMSLTALCAVFWFA